MRMQGHETFRHAVDRLSRGDARRRPRPPACELDDDRPLRLPPGQRPHPARGRRAARPRRERVVNCIDRYGNTSAATIPLALEEARADGACCAGAHGPARRLRRRPHLGRDVVEWGSAGDAA